MTDDNSTADPDPFSESPPRGMSPTSGGFARFCSQCGQPRIENGAFCPSCGARYDPVPPSPGPSVPRRTSEPQGARSGSSPVAVIFLTLLVIGAALWFMNNTVLGLQLKCRYLNDLGACLEVVVSQPQSLFSNGAGGDNPTVIPTAPTTPPITDVTLPPAVIPAPTPGACTVTWFYAPPPWMTKLVTALVKGQNVVTGTDIDAEPITPCEKAMWLAGAMAGGNCQGTVCLPINDTPHGRYDRRLENLP